MSAFSMPEKLLEALEEEKPDLAICGTGFEEMAERLAGYDIPVLVLQETMADAVAEPVTYGSVPESCRGICRYQSMEVILHEVQVMTLAGAGSRRMENIGTGMEVIGVYSPICHEMQMPFSMVLAQKLSTEKKVLYVNLMEHSGMLELLGAPGECDLGEVILALRRQRLTVETLGRGIHETEWLHYVEPFDNPEDLGEMTAGDLQELLEDPAITEIMVNGAKHIFYEKAGRLYKAEYGFSSKEKLNDVIQQMAGYSNRMVNEA